MKTGNPTFDYALKVQEDAKKTIQEGFEKVQSILLGLTQSLNYNNLHQLVKDIDGFYQQRDKTIKILEEIATVEDTKLGEYKQQLQKIYDFGQDVCRLSGIDTQALESSPNGQARLNELYATYCERFSQLITPIRVVHDDILATSATKDQRPILEKYIPYIEKMVPEDRPVFIEQITHHLNSGANPLAIEFSFITHIPQNIYREVYPLPEAVPVPINPPDTSSEESEEEESNPPLGNNQQNNNDEKAMIQELRAQIEQMRQELVANEQFRVQIVGERDNAIIAKDQAIQQVEDRDRIIGERDQAITDLTTQKAGLTNQLNEKQALNEDLILKLAASKAELVPLQEKVAELKIENKDLKDEKIELRAEKKILFDEKKVALEEKKLLVDEKKYYFDLSIEQVSKISLLEQIHCNVPEHDWVPVSGDSQAHQE